MITHQLDILYEMLLLIVVALIPFATWSPCTKGVPYVPSATTVSLLAPYVPSATTVSLLASLLSGVSKLKCDKGTVRDSIKGMFCKGLSLVEAALSDGQIKVLIPARKDKLKRLSSIPWDLKNNLVLVPGLRKPGKFTQRALSRITFPTSNFGTTRMQNCMRSTCCGYSRG